MTADNITLGHAGWSPDYRSNGAIPKTETLLEYMNRTPPLAVRAAAVRHVRGGADGPRVTRKPLTDLLEASGIPRRTFQRLAYKADWTGVPVEVASAFCAACGVDLLKRRPLYEFFRKHQNKKFSFLTTRQRKAMDVVAGKMRKGKL